MNRYLSAAKSLEIAWIAPVLGKRFKMGETAVIALQPALKKMKQKRLTEDRIITYQVSTKKLIEHLKDYTDVS